MQEVLDFIAKVSPREWLAFFIGLGVGLLVFR